MVTFNIKFEPVGQTVKCGEDESILACAQHYGIGLNSVCGGQGICNSCKTQLISGKLSGLTDSERGAFSGDELESGWHLACQTYPRSDCQFNIPLESMTTVQRLQLEGTEIQTHLRPPLVFHTVNLPLPSLTDLEADADRLLRALNTDRKKPYQVIETPVLQDLSPKFRLWQGKFEVITRDRSVIAIMPAGAKKLGLALDIGSTKIAAYLVDFGSGNTLTAKGAINPQISYGDDIISRITHSIKTPGTGEKLQKSVVQAINELIDSMCSGINAQADDILEVTVAGNTVMHHFFLGLPIKQLAVSPFVAAASMALDIRARDMGLHVNPGAYIHMLPNIAGFVGGDHTAMLLGIEAEKISRPAIALDIGTNTEISVIYNGRITCVSCASGPAFEGGHIKNGMRAASGAIERVQISGDSIRYQTIDHNAPIGICGSGILDAMAQMYLAHILDDSGRIVKNQPRVRMRDNTAEYILVSTEELGGKNPIVIDQHDIRELQLAKSAIRTGIEILLKSAGLRSKDLEEVIIAGAFGTYISPESAVTIGMLPPVPLNRFRQVGNAAGMGAKSALVSKQKRKEASRLIAKIRYIELASSPDFMPVYVQSSYLGKYIINDDNKREEVKC